MDAILGHVLSQSFLFDQFRLEFALEMQWNGSFVSSGEFVSRNVTEIPISSEFVPLIMGRGTIDPVPVK